MVAAARERLSAPHSRSPVEAGGRVRVRLWEYLDSGVCVSGLARVVIRVSVLVRRLPCFVFDSLLSGGLCLCLSVKCSTQHVTARDNFMYGAVACWVVKLHTDYVRLFDAHWHIE